MKKCENLNDGTKRTFQLIVFLAEYDCAHFGVSKKPLL